MWDVAAVVIPFAIFAGGMLLAYRRGETWRTQRGVTEPTHKRLIFFVVVMVLPFLIGSVTIRD